MGNVASMPPAQVDFDPRRVPELLKSRKKRWVCWKRIINTDDATKVDKVPFSPDGKKAKANDPHTWADFEECYAALLDGKFHGLGFMLDGDDDIVAWDLDKCLDPASLKMEPWAEEIVRSLDSYTEITPSGRGFRVFCRGRLELKGSGGKGRDNKRIEYYQERRFMTVTGNHWPDSPTAIHENKPLVWEKFLGSQPAEIRRALRNEKFKQLWTGDWQAAGFGSQSDADASLCKFLATLVDGSAERIDELFRRSALYRPKWDEDHHGGRGTYGAVTIARVLEGWTPRTSLTDFGAARRFAETASAKCAEGSWHVWDGARFERDVLQRVVLMVQDVADSYEEQARDAADEEWGQAMHSFANKLRGRAGVFNCLKLAEAQPEIAVRWSDLDRDPMLVNFKNGTLDLRTGDLRAHSPQDLLTKVTDCEFRPDSQAPLWERFLAEVMDGDAEMVGYLQRLCGYTITGLTKEQKFFFLYGTGRNGKSVFWNTVYNILGDYSTMIPKSAIIESKNPPHDTALVSLKGARLAMASEWPEGRRIAEDVVKAIAGDDKIQSRHMYQEHFEFTSTAKLWVVGNHKPTIRGTDQGIWRRVQMVPFVVTIPEDKVDGDLTDKLRAEYPGILRWIVEGTRAYLKGGLRPPLKVGRATEDYKAEQDVLVQFLRDEAAEGSFVYHKELYEAYVKAMEFNKEFVMRNREFAQRLRELGYESARGTGNQLRWVGIHLRSGTRQEEL